MTIKVKMPMAIRSKDKKTVTLRQGDGAGKASSTFEKADGTPRNWIDNQYDHHKDKWRGLASLILEIDI